VRDIDTAVVDSLKVLDPNRPIREADISATKACGGAKRAMKRRGLHASAARRRCRLPRGGGNAGMSLIAAQLA
jgi:hypothetical protein